MEASLLVFFGALIVGGAPGRKASSTASAPPSVSLDSLALALAVPPMTPSWYLQRRSSSSSPVAPEGPLTRAAITSLFARNLIAANALIWTDAKIFPVANSRRLVRRSDWMMWCEIPDAVRRALEGEALAQGKKMGKAKGSGRTEGSDAPRVRGKKAAGYDPEEAGNYLSG